MCMINLVPLCERYDNAMKVLDKMVKMKNQISSHDRCIESGTCLWPNYHEDQSKLKENGTYQNVKVDRDRDTKLYQTRLAVATESAELEKDPIRQAEDNVRILIARLERDLRKEVFSKETIEVIERVRFLTDLRSLSREVMDKGHVYVGATRAEMFLKHTRKITATVDEIPDNEIKENYKAFLFKLERYLEGKSIRKITSISILKDFISSKLRLFEGIELTIQALMCASVKVSVESVVESLVSRYETHFHKKRGLNEKNAMDEMEIS